MTMRLLVAVTLSRTGSVTFNVLAFTTYRHFEEHHAELGIGMSA